MSRFADAIQQSRVDVVPRVVVGGAAGGTGGGSGSIMEGLLTLLLSEKLGVSLQNQAGMERSPEAEALREQIRRSMQKGDAPVQGGEAPKPSA